MWILGNITKVSRTLQNRWIRTITDLDYGPLASILNKVVAQGDMEGV